jgi:hypothetical protein
MAGHILASVAIPTADAALNHGPLGAISFKIINGSNLCTIIGVLNLQSTQSAAPAVRGNPDNNPPVWQLPPSYP